MLNQLGIFEFFSYTLPGGIYLSLIITALTLWSIKPAIATLELDASVLVILVAISYLIGLLMSLIRWTPWDRLFPSQKLETILEKLQQTYPEVILKMHPNQWAVLQANTAFEDREFSLEVDKLRATHLMLRGVSLALFIFSLLLLVYAMGHSHSLISWLGAIGALGASALAARGSRIFRSWAYYYTFELMIARVVKPEDFVERRS